MIPDCFASVLRENLRRTPKLRLNHWPQVCSLLDAMPYLMIRTLGCSTDTHRTAGFAAG